MRFIGWLIEGTLATLIFGPIGFAVWFGIYTVLAVLFIQRCHHEQTLDAIQRQQLRGNKDD